MLRILKQLSPKSKSNLIAWQNDSVLFTDSVLFFEHLRDYDAVDCLTYTFGNTPLHNLRVVITNLVIMHEHPTPAQELYVHTNLHTKLFLCYRKNKLKQVFMGSLNCRLGYNYNLMLLVPSKYHKFLVTYFNEIKSQARKI
jgi:hypothetical protein